MNRYFKLLLAILFILLGIYINVPRAYSASPQIVSEVVEKRTETSKDFLNSDGSYTKVIYQNPIHYLENGEYKDIDRSIKPSSNPDQFENNAGVYKAKFKKNLTANTNGAIRISFAEGEVAFTPLRISWDNGDMLSTVSNVNAQLLGDGSKLAYKSLFGITGIDLEAIYDNEKFLKETVIQNSQAIDAQNHLNNDLEITFALDLSKDLELKINGSIWNQTSTVTTEDDVSVLKNGNEVTRLRRAIAYGSDASNPQNQNNVINIQIRLSRQKNQLILTKIIPGSWLAQAVYPVRTDTTTTFYAYNDGYVNSADPTYSTCRSGNNFYADPNQFNIGQRTSLVWTDGINMWCQESFVQFDTSSIPDSATISSATLSLYGNYNAINASDELRVRVRDYGTSVDTGDYVAGASLSGLTLVAHWTPGTWSTSGYNDFTNDALPANVSKTGDTRLMLHSKFLQDANTTQSFVGVYPSSTAGTSQDPKLTVTYATAPTITSPTNTSIHGSDATLGGNVTSDGGATVTGRGVCVGTSANPALGGNCFSTSGTTGVFTVSATSLTQGTLYHYRAYATNSEGTSYTTDDTFTTLALNNYLVTVVSPQTAGVCVTGTNTVTARDSTNTTITTDASTVNMTSSGTGVTFYTTSGCSSSTTQYTLSSGVANVYYKTNKAQSFTITATKASSTETGTSGSITVNPGSQTRLVVTLPGQTFTDGSGNSGSVTNQTAGVQFTITKISATDDYFNVVTSYSGAKTLAYSGPSSAWGSPSYTTAVSFTSGQSTTTLNTTLYAVETTTITVTDGGSYGYASSPLTINPRGINIRGKVEFRGKVNFQP